MLFADLLLLQIALLMVLFLYARAANALLFWYLAGLYLIILGLSALALFADILIGFLWVIELGAGCIFFIFLLHFTIFLYQTFDGRVFNILLTVTAAFFIIRALTAFDSRLWFFYNTLINTTQLLSSSRQSELATLYTLYFN